MDPHRPSPLPSHPLLSSNSNSIHQTTNQSNGALSALSAMLLGPSRSTSRSKVTTDVSPTNLLARRQKLNGTSEILPLGLEFLNPNRSNLRRRNLTAKNHDRIEEELSLNDDLLNIPAISSNRRKIETTLDESIDDDEFDLPPSPTIFPGGWNDDNKSLMLPAPFLDSRSTRDSFEGLLGTRQVRETSARIRRLERALARDRPPPPAFPQSLIATASKLITSLGPPGGVDSGLLYRKWQDQDEELQGLSSSARKDKRRLDTAEKGLKGLEVGQRTARRWAEKLRKESREVQVSMKAKGVSDILQMEPTIDTTFVRAATPLSLFDDIGALSGFISPPLPDYSPMSYLDSSSSFPSNEPLQTSFDFLPSKPKLAPTFTENYPEPSPFPLPTKLPTRDISDGGYFAIDKKQIPTTDENFLSLETPFDLLDSLPPPPPLISSISPTSSVFSNSPSIPLKEAPCPTSPIKEAAKVISAVGEPLTFAFEKLSTYAKNNLDFLVWILVGSSSPQVFQLSGLEGENVAGLAGALMHLFGFTFFILVHSFALFVSTYATLRSIILFSHWTYLNLTGRTDLSIVAKEYFSFCHVEWNKVSSSDGTRLGIWGVVIGFMEMAAVQAMSREQWLAEGPGNLKLLNGEEDIDSVLEREKEANSTPSRDVDTSSPSSPSRRNYLKKTERIGIARRKSTRAWSTEDREAESLIVTGGEDSILEGTIINESYNPLSHLSPVITSNKSLYEELPPLDIDNLPGGFSPIFTQLPSPLVFAKDPPVSPPLRPLPDVRPLSALLKNIKRCVRLSTASYGLHSYVLAPPTPLFTPSGASIAQHIFSHLGGVESKNVLHVAIQKDYLGIPTSTTSTEAEYEPQFYLLRDDLNSEIICVIRGTQSLHDVRIDLEATEVNLELPSLVPGGENEVYRSHGGILAAARRLLNPELSALFPKLRTVMQEHENYALVLTGHSLGSAIASTIAILVSQYEEGSWKTHSSSGLPVGRACRAICFAPPAIFETRLASRCALGKEALILSISLSCDVVVRMGIPQVREVRRALGRLQKRRDGMSILTAWWKWKRAGGGELLDEEGEQKSELVKSIERNAWEWRKEMDHFGLEEDDHNETENDGLMIPAGRALHLDRLPAMLELKRKKELEEVMDEDEDDEELPGIFGLYEVQNPALFFRCPHLEADLIQKHLPRFYLDSIESL